MRHVLRPSVSARYTDVSRRVIRCLAAAAAVVATLSAAPSARATGGAGGSASDGGGGDGGSSASGSGGTGASGGSAPSGEIAYLPGCQSDDDCGEGQMCTAQDGALGDCVAALDEAGGAGGTAEASQSLRAGAWQCAHLPADTSADTLAWVPAAILAWLAARARLRAGATSGPRRSPAPRAPSRPRR